MRDKREPIYGCIGERVKRAREELGWSQEDIASEVGMSRASLANIELGKVRVSIHKLQDVADVLGIPYSKLIPTRAEVQRSIKSKIRELQKELEAQ